MREGSIIRVKRLSFRIKSILEIENSGLPIAKQSLSFLDYFSSHNIKDENNYFKIEKNFDRKIFLNYS